MSRAKSATQIITLTTDFGAADWFAGAVKGVILGINPQARIVDITHEIPPGDIRAGAFALAASYASFPINTIHIAIVDPGVGSSRNALAVKTARHCFLGPDNGVLSLALAREKVEAIHRLQRESLFLQPVSHTFHGRDILAPVAARLSQGMPITKVGPGQKKFVRLPWPRPKGRPGCFQGEIFYIDRFGNAITNFENALVTQGMEWQMRFGRDRSCPVRAFYQAVAEGKPVAVPGSSGYLELAVNGGSAAGQFGLRPGLPVALDCRRARRRRLS